MNEQDTIQANVKKFEDINELKSLIKQQRVFEKSLKLSMTLKVFKHGLHGANPTPPK